MYVTPLNSEGEPSDEEPRELDSDAAVSLIGRGLAELAPYQLEPPFELLAHARQKLANLDALGPASVAPGTFELIDRHIVPNGLRQDHVEGLPLRWMTMRRGGAPDPEFGVALCNCAEADGNIFIQLRRCLNNKTERSPCVRSPGILSDDQLRANSWIPEQPTGLSFIAETEPYYAVSRDWCEFYFAFRATDRALKEAFWQGVQAGQILVVEETERGDRLIAPENAIPRRHGKKAGKRKYLMTRDLPAKWFQVPGDRDRTIRQARDLLERMVRHFADEGRRLSLAQVQRDFKRRFGLSDNGVKTLWGNVDRPHKSVSGNIPAAERVDDQELARFE